MDLFCTEADELHKEMMSCPRPLPRIATTPLPPTPKEKKTANDNRSESPSLTPPRCLLETRRMSRSEGDLKKFVTQQPPLLRSAGSQQHLLIFPSNHFMHKVRAFFFSSLDSERSNPLLFHSIPDQPINPPTTAAGFPDD